MLCAGASAVLHGRGRCASRLSMGCAMGRVNLRGGLTARRSSRRAPRSVREGRGDTDYALRQTGSGAALVDLVGSRCHACPGWPSQALAGGVASVPKRKPIAIGFCRWTRLTSLPTSLFNESANESRATSLPTSLVRVARYGNTVRHTEYGTVRNTVLIHVLHATVHVTMT
jgi:hypothetical protein